MQKRMIVFLILLVLSLAVSGCSDKEDSIVKFEDGDGNEYEVTYNEGSADDSCPVGTVWTLSNPGSGELVTMEVVGTRVVEGIEMCHAVYETSVPDDDGMVRMEYLWSNEDDESFIWTAYDRDGNILSEMKAMKGKVTMTDNEGNVMEFSTNS
ncbi:MAG: membrane-binding protein [Methanolobus sp.]|nr:membrane-binding protein [Methanolobus sp.]